MMSSSGFTITVLCVLAHAAEPEPMETLWATLADPDPMVAYPALWELRDRPGEAVPFIRKNLPPAKGPDQQAVDALIDQLDSGVFRSREKATAELIALGPDVEPILTKALGTDDLPAETRRRLETVIQRLPDSPARLRQRRAIQVLEYAGTPEARELLGEWSGGLEGAWLTEEAKSAVIRLERRGRVDR